MWLISSEKYVDVSRTQELSQVIFTFFGFSLGKL